MNGVNGGLDNTATLEPDAQLEKLKQAINAIYDPRSSNDVRRDATLFLDELKAQPRATSTGFALASSNAESAVIRHFGLSLLEHTIRYRWDALEHAEAESCRTMVVDLAQKMDDTEKTFLRNKVAQLWVDIAKKVWPEDWHGLDVQLLELFSASFAHQMMVLQMLEMLSDDAFAREDYGDGIKGGNVGKACSEIFIPAKTYSELFPNRDQLPEIRAGHEGWIIRLVDRLAWARANISDGSQPKACAIQILYTLRSAALDGLLVLLTRPQYGEADVQALVCPLLSQQGLQLFYDRFTSSQVSVHDAHELKYMVRKKLAENSNAPLTIDLIETVLRDASLVVSIPALYLWTRILVSPSPTVASLAARKYESLLETCTKRTLRYGNLPEDSQDETFLFLHLDFDTMPERHAFVGNYRRYCSEVIEKVVKTSPREALDHFLNQTLSLIDAIPTESPRDETTYSSSSYECLRVDAQCTVVTSAIKSYCSWYGEQRAHGKEQGSNLSEVQASMQNQCTDLQRRSFGDPTLQKRIAQLIGEVVLSLFGEDPNYALSTFYAILDKIEVREAPANPFGEAVKEANFTFARLLQKLAMKFATPFMSHYSDIQQRVEPYLDSQGLDRRLKMDLRAALFLIVHRCLSISNEERLERLQSMMQPIVASWQEPTFAASVSPFESFCKLLDLRDVPEYFLEGRAHSIEDWSSIKLNQKGHDMRESIQRRLDTLPMHNTKAFLTVSTDRVRPDSREHQTSVMLWESCIPIILPTLLPLLSNAHAFSNPQRWENFGPEMQTIIHKILMDRVWQAGISNESRDEFYNRVRTSRDSLEGLGSAIRASVRSVRELSYWILHCFAQFGDALFQHQDLAEPLARALYDDAHTLSSHQVSTLLQISQALIDGCPVHRRRTFLPVLLTNLFNQVDRKLAVEWERMNQRQHADLDEESLDLQMKAESVLRQLSVAAVHLACTLLQPVHQGMTQFSVDSCILTGYSAYHRTQEGTKVAAGHEPLSKMAFAEPAVLSSIIMFCTHVLRIPDSRSCTRIINLFCDIIPELGRRGADGAVIVGQNIPSDTAAELREFFASEVLKNAISSFHEPYFADLQRDLAWLMAQTIFYCGEFTETPRQILLSLPNMSEQKINEALAALGAARKNREKRDVILKLLENLRGVSIHEIGKVTVPTARKKRKTIQEQFMKVDDDATHIRRGGSPEPGAMSDLFG
ncbi:MAG: hypothetical protein Q9159_007562 [Coniocarpon cinnabarinum]